MASTPKSTTQEPRTVMRTLRVGLYPGTAANGQYLEQLAGACRFAWNHVLAGHETDYRLWKASGWGQLERKLAYKAGQVEFVDPAYTSQACSQSGTPPSQTDRRRRCFTVGLVASRRTPTTMRCSTSWCGRDFRPHPFRPAGLGLLHGEERSLPGRSQGQPKGLPRPVNRICVVSTIVYKPQSL